MDSCLSKGYLFRRYIVHRDQLGSGQRPESTAREILTEPTESGSERMGNIIIPYGSKILRSLTAESFNYRQ